MVRSRRSEIVTRPLQVPFTVMVAPLRALSTARWRLSWVPEGESTVTRQGLVGARHASWACAWLARPERRTATMRIGRRDGACIVVPLRANYLSMIIVAF